MELVRSQDKWPVAGTRAERRATCAVTLWFGVAALSGLAFVLALLFWPYEYRAPFEEGHRLYALYTPVAGWDGRPG